MSWLGAQILMGVGALVAFVAAPFLLGYITGWYPVIVIPLASLIAATAAAVSDASDPPDENEALTLFWVIGSVLAVGCCVAGVALRKVHRRSS